ncbi:sporulation membrane protein YtaF [Paenibacillus antri]|uniref:Sporulation membrane protein YtaF n=1 Tax=Paenibacillus antri TaxID=2582848 RepID=A0A5R9G6P8_9BACL|nr:MntP/YtaF family protein [Paenibacillus antri]TLS48423.1 sporulation membrane protein YtaF [Paenibacillus antri]
MVAFGSMLALALAVSLDGLSAGMMYGIRKIRIPAYSIGIVSLLSAFVLFGSMAVGGLFVEWLPERAARWTGAAILIAIGAWAIVQMLLTSRRESAAGDDPSKPSGADASAPAEATPAEASAAAEKTVLQWEIRQFGLIIRIWRTPSMADMDRSGVITASEAVLLGIALSLDSLGAGVGAALIGFPPVATSLMIGAACGACIAIGVKLGFLLSGWRWIGKLTLLPGCILIVMGFMKLM